MADHAGDKVVKHSNEQVAKLQSPFSKEVTIVLVACFLIASRAAHSILCQPFKIAKVDVTVLIVIVEAISFPVSMLIWVAMSLSSQGKVYVPNWRYRMLMYALMGFLDAVNSYMSAFSALNLEVAVYTVLKASSIVFSVLFAKMFTKKQFTAWHYLAVAIMFGASFLSLYSAKNNDASFSMQVIWGGMAALLSAASLGLLGVTTYKFVRHEDQKSEMLCIAENNAFQALFMFLFVLPMLAMREVPEWPVLIAKFSERYSMTTFIGICVGFLISRPVMLFSSIAATSFASAAMTRALGAPRRLIVVIFVRYAFGEEINRQKGFSIALMCISLMIYAYGGFILRKMKKSVEKLMTIKVDEKGVSSPAKKELSAAATDQLWVPTKKETS